MDRKTLGLTVDVASPISGGGCPVTGGIPFPRGGLSSTDGIQVHGPDGRQAPLQTEVLATWDPEGTQVRWLLVDFLVSRLQPGRTSFTLVHGPAVPRGDPGDHVDPAASPWPPERILQSLYMVDGNGTVYRPDLEDGDTRVETETSGPLRTVVRAHVWHVDGEGSRFCRAILRLHYYGRIDRVRIYHSFVMDADPESHRVRGLGLKLKGPSDPAQVLLSGEQDTDGVLTTRGSVALLQDRDDHFRISGSVEAEGRRSGTWLCVSGREESTGVFVRHGWEEFPTGVVWDGRHVDIQLWPTGGCPLLDLGPLPGPLLAPDTEEELRAGLAEHPGASVSMYRFVTRGQTDWTIETILPLMERAKELEAELLPGRYYYYYGIYGGTGRGTMKTHEIVLSRFPVPVSDQELVRVAAEIRFPPVVCASSEWNCSTGAFGPNIPYGLSGFTEVDRGITYDEFENTGAFIEKLGLFGDRDFGDYFNGIIGVDPCLHKVYGPDAEVRIPDRVGWQGNESDDSTVGAWLHFLRTGDPRIFYRAESACEHIASVDQQHLFPSPDRHLAVTNYHTVNHYDGGDCPSHTLNSGILLGYYITGDRGWRETALANADYFVDAQQRDGTGFYAGPDPSRQNIAPMTCVINAHTLTWDRKYLESVERFLPVWAPVYDPERHLLGGTLEYPGAEFARLVDHVEFKRAFHRVIDELRTVMRVDGQGSYHMPAMVYMWEVTGDASYLAHCLLCFEWYTHNLRATGSSDRVNPLTFGLPEWKYGALSGYLTAGLAGLEEARVKGVDMRTAMEKLRADRARVQGVRPEDALYYSVYGNNYTFDSAVQHDDKWYPPELE